MSQEQVSEAGDRDFISGLQKGLSVIECFDDEHERLTSAEAATRTGLSRAAARRCLLTLHKLGYADYDGKVFSLAPRTLRLGYAYLLSATLPQLLQPFLEHLSEQFEESASAAILEGDEIVYLARAARKRILPMGLCIGTRLPAYCTGMGRVLLASLEPHQAVARLEQMDRPRLTPKTRTRLDDLTEILEQVRRDGYCVVDQELEINLISIAVPVYDSAGRVVAAINFASSPERVRPEEMADRFLAPLERLQRELRPIIRRP